MISTAFWNPIGAKCKCGSEAKEVEFLRNRPSVCLTLLMGPGFTFSPDTGTVQQIIELGLLSSVLPSAGHWGTVIVALHTWGRLLIALWSGDTDNLQKWFLPFSVLTKTHGLKKKELNMWSEIQPVQLWSFLCLWSGIFMYSLCAGVLHFALRQWDFVTMAAEKTPVFIPLLPVLNCNQLWLEGKNQININVFSVVPHV